jgi:hypothetical protein
MRRSDYPANFLVRKHDGNLPARRVVQLLRGAAKTRNHSQFRQSPANATKNMSRQTQIYYAKKFYPHFLLKYGVLAIRASLETFKIPYEEFEL